MMAGLSQRAIAKQLLPAVNNVRASARRVARTEGLRVLHAAQDRCHEQIDDIIAGQQIHATIDANTRPHHRARNGAVWMKGSSETKQEALQLEHGADGVPDEANCRCWISPIMTPPAHIVNDPAKMAVFTQNAGKVVPDPKTWDTWFQGADDRRRRVAVGVKRLRAAERIVGKDQLTYAHLVDIKGRMLSVKHLESETSEQRAERVGKVQAIFAHRAELIRQTSTFGFLTPAA
jgi:SPP1 gp7 family putative phage head morphogenesis protein